MLLTTLIRFYTKHNKLQQQTMHTSLQAGPTSMFYCMFGFHHIQESYKTAPIIFLNMILFLVWKYVKQKVQSFPNPSVPPGKVLSQEPADLQPVSVRPVAVPGHNAHHTHWDKGRTHCQIKSTVEKYEPLLLLNVLIILL